MAISAATRLCRIDTSASTSQGARRTSGPENFQSEAKKDFFNTIGAKWSMEKVSDRWLRKTHPGTPRGFALHQNQIAKKIAKETLRVVAGTIAASGRSLSAARGTREDGRVILPQPRRFRSLGASLRPLATLRHQQNLTGLLYRSDPLGYFLAIFG
jgi:hypothetical protein